MEKLGSETRTEEKNKSNIYFLNYRGTKERKKKLGNVFFDCMIDKIWAVVNQPPETLAD